MQRCYRCGAEWLEIRRPSLKETCEQCQSFWHCCLNCTLYDESQPNHCRSRTTESVRDCELGNVCGEFVLKSHEADTPDIKPNDSRGKWSDLFRR